MRLLFDTHLLIWAAGFAGRLPSQARELLEDPQTIPVFSVASILEVAVKRGLERDNFDVDPRTLRRGMLKNEYEELPITGSHVIALETLPLLHRDLFDRILIAQAITEDITLNTKDRMIARYAGPIRLV